MFGLLNLDKPAGVTSRDVVNRVQRLVRPHKVGHAGTLDPLATGVLVVALGPATRLVEYVQQMPKTYRGTFLLGRTSDTEDIDGCVSELPAAPRPSEEELRAALPRFLGTIQQQPPAFSALKVAGKRAYELARLGEAVMLAPRPVEIHALEIVRYEYPQLELAIVCGSGTYVRTLGRDLACACGTDCVMSALRREAIGPFHAAEALLPSALTLDEIQSHLLPAQMALGNLPQVVLLAADTRRVSQGQRIDLPNAPPTSELAAIDEHGRLTGILHREPTGAWGPTKCFPS